MAIRSLLSLKNGNIAVLSNIVTIFDKHGKELNILNPGDKKITHISEASGNKLAVSVQNELWIWNIKTSQLDNYHFKYSVLSSFEISPGLFGIHTGILKIVDLKNRRVALSTSTRLNEKLIEPIILSNGDIVIASTEEKGVIVVMRDYKAISVFQHHSKIKKLFPLFGDRLAVLGLDRTLTIYDVYDISYNYLVLDDVDDIVPVSKTSSILVITYDKPLRMLDFSKDMIIRVWKKITQTRTLAILSNYHVVISDGKSFKIVNLGLKNPKPKKKVSFKHNDDTLLNKLVRQGFGLLSNNQIDKISKRLGGVSKSELLSILL